MITVVIGLPGAGKTQWIKKQVSKSKYPVVYYSPQNQTFPIDVIYLQSEVKDVQVFSYTEIDELRYFSHPNSQIYLEIPWHIDLAASETLIETLNYRRVAIFKESDEDLKEWKNWADEVIISYSTETNDWQQKIKNLQLQIQQVLLSEEVLDFPSLETFWRELIQGAYGEVIRAKGIFEIIDGRSIYGEFTQGLPVQDFEPLNIPLNLEGRPKRFSGLEIIGENLDKDTIADTLAEFCLSDQAIAYYQQQVKESLSLEAEEIK